MTSGTEWWEPVGAAGRLEVRELLDAQVRMRYHREAPDHDYTLGSFEIVGELATVTSRWLHPSVRISGEPVADLDLGRAADDTRETGWVKQLILLGTPLVAELAVDRPAGSRWRGPLRYLHLHGGEHSWVWSFEGGRTSGERLVLAAGDHPTSALPRVITYPSSRGRAVGGLHGGATPDTHVTTWEPTTTPAEIVIAELFATARLESLVDYRAARVAAGFSELVDVLPRPDANTE